MDRTVSLVLQAFPGLVRLQVESVPLPLQEETDRQGHLRIRLLRPLVIHQGGQGILSSLQVWCEVHGLIAPMGHIALGGAHGHQRAIDIQLIPVVTGHMDHIVRRDGRQVDVLPEIIHAVILRSGTRHADPAGVPQLGLQVERDGRIPPGRGLRKSRRSGKKQQDG